MGLDGFVWWMGVVENRKDPLKIGRCQVRIFGWHTDNKSLIPSADLPWAHPIIPINETQKSSGPKEGQYVFGFFSDGPGAQFPIMVGIFPGIPDQIPNVGKGFSDQRTDDDLKNSPREPNSLQYQSTGNGVIISEKEKAQIYPNRFNEPTTSRLYRNENIANTVVGLRRETLDKQVPTAGPEGLLWDEPYPAYNTTPPFNHVTETESGHAFEMDDTPGSERVNLMHRTGTFIEMYPTGTKVEKVVKDNYQIVLGNDFVHVMGKVNITVDSDCNLLTRGDINIIGGNNLTGRIAGKINLSAGEEINLRAPKVSVDAATIDIKASSTIREDSAVKHMTANTYYETSGKSYYKWLDDRYYYVGKDTYLVREPGYTDYTCPTSRSSGEACPEIPLAVYAILPKIPEGPFRSKKNSPVYSPEDIPVPNLAALVPDDITPELGQALRYASFAPSTENDESVQQAISNTSNLEPNPDASCIPINELTPSDACIEQIKKSEGFSSKAYPDPATKAEPITIGYGATASALGRPVRLGDTVTEAQATEDLKKMVSKFAGGVKNKLTTQCVTQGQFDAMVSFAYNVGLGNFGKSSVLSLTNAGDKAGAGNALLLWNKAGGKVLNGLTTRREQEKSLYLS